MRDLNWFHITETLDEIAEAASDIQWMDENEIAEALGDEEEAYEFRTAFSDLAGDCERFRDELSQVREYDFISTDSDGEDEATLFDLFFPAVGSGGERKYTWKRAAQEFAAMYWEEREREEAELEAEYDA
ncbi:MAG: hypothetical protein IIZ51_10560 [Lachnospiraceae bacterium]|nr:hypothetical protein [Lachnospiraceae bacterium]